MLPFLKNNNDDTWLFVGLGNPGDEHQGNRHNIGFMLIDALASEYNFSSFRSKFQGHLSEGKLENQKLILLKPITYMNNSGQSVKAAAKFFKIKPERIVVFHDELDLEPGKIRIKQGGGNAGHNGLKSVQAHMGSPGFWRVRMGIGHPGDRNKVHSYVLKDFAKTEQKWLEPLLDACARHAGLLVQGEVNDYMSKVVMDIKAA